MKTKSSITNKNPKFLKFYKLQGHARKEQYRKSSVSSNA